jgi:NADH-quinone oxidoreductase subunit C
MAEESLTLRKLREKFADSILETHSFRGDDTAIIAPQALVAVCRLLKEDPELDYNFLMDLTAVDGLQLNLKPRFEVVYHFFSLSKKNRVRIKVPADGRNPEVDSIVRLWPGADWYEREVWDMFGIKFRGHPDLKRILMYEEFQGYPLRKDYPINKRQPLIGPGSKSDTGTVSSTSTK